MQPPQQLKKSFQGENPEREDPPPHAKFLDKRSNSFLEKSRKKKLHLGLKNVRGNRFAYNQYVERPSILDQVLGDSLIAKSPFKGLLRMVLVITFLSCLNNFLVGFPTPNDVFG